MTPQSSDPSQPKIIKRTRPALLIALLCAALAMGGVLLDSSTHPRLICGPMIQIPAPSRLTVVWEMDGFWKTGGVQLQLLGEQVAEVRCRNTKDHRFEATFSNLTPGTEYEYVLVNYGLFGRTIQLAGPFKMQTPVPPGKDFRFIAFGDSGNGSHTQADLAAVLTSHKSNLVIHTGDLIYPSGEMKDYLPNFFEPNAALIRSVPFMPSLGNHDCVTDKGKPYLDVFVLPENGPKGVTPERNYYFDFGDGRFIALDSNPPELYGEITAKARHDLVAPWVRDTLTHCNARWKFVYYHHPFYTGSQHTAESAKYMKDDFARIFEECGVDIVFNGHNHLYERTAPIMQDKIVPDGQGIVYIVTGAGGADRYQELKSPEYIREHHDEVFSFTQVDLSPTRLHLQQIDEKDRVIDEYTINKPLRSPS
jgi:hypothetical protein